ncbi:MAG: formate dehydrogenase subunit gamma [Planctomycetota bacterium]
MSCHRFRGLSRIDKETGALRLFFCSAEFYAERQGPHARLRCTGCHKRDEVSVIPHKVKTPVDCTHMCHIVPASGVEISFSHQRVSESLERSSHSSEKLNALTIDPPLLKPGQSTCLYCHDQPVYRKSAQTIQPPRHGDITTRCNTCHGEEMPVDVAYFMYHVSARLQPSRSVRQLAQTCAVCHSDQNIITQTGSHDTVASYLHSFHGKASLLGSTATATCIDCHASDTGDVHYMLGKDHRDSSIHENQLPNTCRTAQCHPGAPPGMSGAAIHLDLDPRARTPEFYVAAIFVILTAGVMVVYFILIMLELFNKVVRRSGEDHQRLIHLAQTIQKHPEGGSLLRRMNVHQRVQHWIMAVFFILLVVTGMPLKFADTDWAEKLTGVLGGLMAVRNLHRLAGVILIAVFIYHLSYMLARFIGAIRLNRRQGKNESIWQILADSPVTITPTDVRSFGQLFAHLLFLRRKRPHFGYLNFMQKFEYWAVFWGMPIMGLSGLVLWGAASVTEYASGRALNFAFIIHSDEAYLAFIYIAVVHMFSVIFSPVVFPVSLGTLTGQIPAEEMAEAHLGQLEEVAKKLGIQVESVPPSGWGAGSTAKDLVRRIYSALLLVLCAVICYTSMNFLFTLLFTRQTAPIDIVEIPKRLDADMLQPSSETYVASTHVRDDRPRGPLAHFHQIPSWYQADPGNSCSTSGCHVPLPHGDRIEIRAFLNMHSTFLDCGVCHSTDAEKSATARWFSLPERNPRTPPAVLRLADLIEQEGEVTEDEARGLNEKLIQLLHEALLDSGYNAQLEKWLLRLETTNTQSKLWQSILADIRSGIRMHVHGEYNAKIGLYTEDKMLGLPSDEQKTATTRYLAEKETLSDDQQQSLLATVHKDVLPEGALCTPCHSPDPKLIDFTTIGYPKKYADSMKSSEVVRQMLNIEKGRPFNIPRILEGGHDR